MTENMSGGQFLIQSTSKTAIFTPEDFTKEHKAIAKSVKEFVAGEIQSRGDEIEHVNNELCRELMRSAGEIGLLAADVPEEYDGMALDKISSLIISDFLGEGAGSFTITELNHTGIGTLPVAFFGTEDQKKRYLPGLSSGELIGMTLERHKNGLRSQQELAGIISNMLIEIYAFESAYLRAWQMDVKEKGRGRATAMKIAKVMSVQLYDKLGSLTCRALPALADDTSLPEKLALAAALLCPPPIDTITLNRQIAEQCVSKKGYPFKVV